QHEGEPCRARTVVRPRTNGGDVPVCSRRGKPSSRPSPTHHRANSFSPGTASSHGEFSPLPSRALSLIFLAVFGFFAALGGVYIDRAKVYKRSYCWDLLHLPGLSIFHSSTRWVAGQGKIRYSNWIGNHFNMGSDA